MRGPITPLKTGGHWNPGRGPHPNYIVKLDSISPGIGVKIQKRLETTRPLDPKNPWVQNEDKMKGFKPSKYGSYG